MCVKWRWKGRLRGRGDGGLSLPQTIALTCIPVWQTRGSKCVCKCLFHEEPRMTTPNKPEGFPVSHPLINACTKSLHVSSVSSSALTIPTWEFLSFAKSFQNWKCLPKFPNKFCPMSLCPEVLLYSEYKVPITKLTKRSFWKCHKSVFESASFVKHLIWTWF